VSPSNHLFDINHELPCILQRAQDERSQNVEVDSVLPQKAGM